jgi:hypothetical protein
MVIFAIFFECRCPEVLVWSSARPVGKTHLKKSLDSSGFTDINGANIFKSYARRWSFFLRIRNDRRAPGLPSSPYVAFWKLQLNFFRV